MIEADAPIMIASSHLRGKILLDTATAPNTLRIQDLYPLLSCYIYLFDVFETYIILSNLND